MSILKPTTEGNADIVADTKAGVTITRNTDGTITVATNNLRDGKPVEGTYDPKTPLKEVEEDLEGRAGE